MITKIQINPNLRLSGDLTMVDLDEDVVGPLRSKFQDVEVFEPTSGLRGRGWLVDIDPVERTATIAVDWAQLVLPQGTQAATAGPRASLSFDLVPRAVIPRTQAV
jgi:hypothetical protein